MSIKATDPILGPSRGDPVKFLSVFVGPDQKDSDYVMAVAKYARIAGMDDAIVNVQFCQECTDPGSNSPGTSVRWNRDLNPAGIGIPLDTTNQPVKIQDGDEAARIHVQCLYSLVKRVTHPGVPIPPQWLPWFTHVWLPKVCDVLAPQVSTLADLNIRYTDTTGEKRATWAWDDQYTAGLLAYAAKWLPWVADAGTDTKDNAMTKPRILLTEGHRNTTGGNAEEAALTPLMAQDVAKALRAAGYAVDIFQEIDGDNAADYTNGDLDAVGRGALAWANGHPGDLVMLDLHYEGDAEGIRGCFAIIPDEQGLNGNAPNSNPGNDTWANNPLDVQLGRAIANRIATATGLPLRTAGVTEPGLMSERQTGVGYQGYRLAMFGWTAPARDRMVRLVIEHGNHTDSHDHALIFTDTFTDKCAAAYVAAFNEVYGVPTPQPTPAPKPTPQVKYAPPIPATASASCLPYPVTATAATSVTPRQRATKKAKATGPDVAAGAKVEMAFTVWSQTEKAFWLIDKLGSRFPASAFRV